MPVLQVEISAGTAERLKRKYRKETNNYSEKTFDEEDFDDWFNKWLNLTLYTEEGRKKI